MLATLLVGTALAAPPQLGLALGPVMGGGESTLGTYFSAAPATAVTVTWHLGPFETWIGASGSLLLAGVGDDVIPASLLQGEVGLGFGGRAGGAGLYGGNGLPGPIAGLYARGTVPGRGWVRRVGVETRLFHTRATDSTAVAVLLRLEPGLGRRERLEIVEEIADAEAPADERTVGASGGPAVEEAPTGATASGSTASEAAPSEAASTEAASSQPASSAPASNEPASTHHAVPY